MKYDWKFLFLKKSFKLRHGVDYACARSSMPQQIRNAACRHGRFVRIEETEDGFTVTVSMKPFVTRRKHAKTRTVRTVYRHRPR